MRYARYLANKSTFRALQILEHIPPVANPEVETGQAVPRRVVT